MEYSILDGIPDSFPKRYDLVITIEVLEHLYEDESSELTIEIPDLIL